MKKNGILNSDISSILSYMGHTDTICIADCGLPIPEEAERIDLALRFGMPSFIETLKTVMEDMKVEAVVFAEEIKEKNPSLHDEVTAFLKETDASISVTYVPHTDFKERTHRCKAVIRTGENTPYANIILQSGVIF